MFFAAKDAYAPCGVYTAGHFAATLVCFALTALLVFALRRTRLERIYFLMRCLSVILTVLELVKIGHNFYHGYTNIDSWVPLSFCSLFIYACYMTGYGRGRVREMGVAFITVGGVIAGAVFISVPTTSLTLYPLFHFQSLYSLLFHSFMVASGILLLKNGIRPTERIFHSYLLYFGVFAAAALIINFAFGSNLMTFREPYKLPLDFLHLLYDRVPLAYTALAVIGHAVLPFAAIRILCALCFRKAPK